MLRPGARRPFNAVRPRWARIPGPIGDPGIEAAGPGWARQRPMGEQQIAMQSARAARYPSDRAGEEVRALECGVCAHRLLIRAPPAAAPSRTAGHAACPPGHQPAGQRPGPGLTAAPPILLLWQMCSDSESAMNGSVMYGGQSAHDRRQRSHNGRTLRSGYFQRPCCRMTLFRALENFEMLLFFCIYWTTLACGLGISSWLEILEPDGFDSYVWLERRFKSRRNISVLEIGLILAFFFRRRVILTPIWPIGVKRINE